jgi:DsbC/DsbD-like thiol-disulfide interchange protein
MMCKRAAILGLMALLMGSALAQDRPQENATAWVELHGGKARLVSGPGRSPSDHYLAGVEIVLEEGWKTYWRMPGDAGVPPTFDWAGSDNIGSVKVYYPAPKRMPEAGGQVVAYKQGVLFPVAVKPLDAAKPVRLKVAVEFGICREICIPASANFDLSLDARRPSAPVPKINEALSQVPRSKSERRPTDPKLKSVEVNRDQAVPRLLIEGEFTKSGADVFIEAPEGLFVPLPKKVDARGGATRFEVDLAGGLDKDLKGKVITLTLVDDAGASEVEWRIP